MGGDDTGANLLKLDQAEILKSVCSEEMFLKVWGMGRDDKQENWTPSSRENM